MVRREWAPKMPLWFICFERFSLALCYIILCCVLKGVQREKLFLKDISLIHTHTHIYFHMHPPHSINLFQNFLLKRLRISHFLQFFVLLVDLTNSPLFAIFFGKLMHTCAYICLYTLRVRFFVSSVVSEKFIATL